MKIIGITMKQAMSLRKRQRTTLDMVKEGKFGAIPPIVEHVKNVFAYGKWELSDPCGKKYTIEMRKMDGAARPFFQCDCIGDGIKVTHCQHINSVILSICLHQAIHSDMVAKEKEIAGLLEDFNKVLSND